jgi:hypothetical protein
VRRRKAWGILLLAVVLLGGWFVLRWLPKAALLSSDTLTPEERDVLAKMYTALPRDAILPIYKPRFIPTAQARLRAEDLVMGVEIGGRAKAYPVAILNRREMVNDELHGVPILITW